MKNFKKWTLFFCVGLIFAFTSCEKNEVTKISLSKSSLSFKVGQTDSIQTVISISGDIDAFPVSWVMDHPEIVSLKELDTELNSTGNKNDLSKKVVLTALKAGTTKLTIKVGEKSMSCDITVTQTSYAFNQVITSNWGDFYDIGTNNFDMLLLENTLNLNTEGKIEGSGNYLYLEFNVPVTQNGIHEGNYLLSTTGAVNTFFAGEEVESDGKTYILGSRVVSKSGTKSTTKLVTDGSFSITATGGGYIVEGEMVTEDKDVFRFKYQGVLVVKDEREVPVELKPKFTQGRLYYLGDAYNSKKANNFIVYLASESVNFESTNIVGELLMLEVNTALTVTDTITSGTYNMMAKLNLESIIPFSLILGYTNEKGDEYGSWYYGETDKKLRTGSINVSKSGNVYTIIYELYDRFGSKIWGTYKGQLKYFNVTAPSSVPGLRANRSNLTKVFPAKQTKMKRIKFTEFK